jgi:probable HAF family extracellular repeat protein
MVNPTIDTAEGFLYDGKNFSLIDFPGAFRTQAFGINNSGKIVGAYNTDQIPMPGQAFHGFLYDGTDFISIDFPDAFTTTAIGINNRGQIVGGYREASGTDHGFLATPQRPRDKR